MAVAACSIGSFDATDPQAFYLLDARADWEALSDATLVVQGARLPVHSQVLSLQSGVLRGLFADLGPTGGTPGRGTKRKADDQVLEEPFSDCRLFDVVLFLRFCYRPRDLTPASLAAVLDGLPGLLRLAHKLDAPQILGDVSQHMAGAANAPTVTRAQLLEWAAAADHCQLPELCLRCLSQLARRFADVSDSPAAAFAATEVLQGCSSHLSNLLCGMLLAAGGKRLGSSLPAPGPAAEAVQRAANLGSFEWALEAFSQQPAGVGQVVLSPYFPAAGRRWRFVVYPGGESAETAGHLSVYLEAKRQVQAKYSIAVLNEGTEQQKISSRNEAKQFGAACSGWGWSKFMPLAEPGHLAGDRLVLRARVEVVP